MPFTPIALPIQQLLLTDFVTDIASITNSNTLLLQAQVEDLINNFEIDTNGMTIGTDNPITSIKTQSLIMNDTGFLLQTGSPNPSTIASLVKNGSGQSVLTVDILNVNTSSGFNGATLNTLTLNGPADFNGETTFDGKVAIRQGFSESKENVVVLLEANSPVTPVSATGTLTLTNTSRQNIFVTLKASMGPVSSTPVYNGTDIINTITTFNLNINFDATNPPAENTVFTIHIADTTEATLNTSILSKVQLAQVQILIKGNQNLNAAPVAQIITHDNVNSVGVQNSATLENYGTNVSFVYIKDSNTNDRLIVKSLVGAQIF
jgi:hypothetical protein